MIYRELDARGLTPGKPEALSIAIHALGKSKHERFRHLDGRALRKAFQRARARLPEGYDRWVGLVTKWDRSYTTQKARNLVDRLITAIGNRPRRILERVFEHLEQQFCESWSKKVKRLELQCEHLEKDEFYMPRLRDLKSDDLPDRVYGALASGAKTRKQLSELLARTSAMRLGCRAAPPRRRANRDHHNRRSLHLDACRNSSPLCSFARGDPRGPERRTNECR